MSTDLILIADGNAGRGKRIATSLEAAGHACRVAADGAAALEMALADTPRLIVTRGNLPLLSPDKLVEILRANPRTRSARFLFLGLEASESEQLAGVGDETLEASAETNEIHDAVERLLEREARIASLEERAEADREFEGELAELRPAELLQLLSLRRASGRLTFTALLDDGSSPSGWVLVGDGEIHSAETGRARAAKALFRMLDWQQGEFHFEPRSVVGAHELRAPTRSLLLEGLRQREEWNRLAPRFPPLASPVKLTIGRDELPDSLHPLTQAVVARLDEADSVAEIVDACPEPDYQVLRTLHTLAERGLVEFGRARIAAAEASGHALFNEAQCRRLRAFALQGLSRESAPPCCKLVVVAVEQAITERFAALVAKVPGAELSPRVERGELTSGDLESLAHLDIDGDFGIDLVHLPRDTSFEAIWPFVGHRALGTIFLLDAKMGVAAAGLTPIGEALSEAADARTFHVVLLGEGERLSPDELRDNLRLIDDASLFLLPLEANKDSASVLRSLFARIVP